MKSFRRVVCDVSDDSNKSADDKVATFVDNLRLLHAFEFQRWQCLGKFHQLLFLWSISLMKDFDDNGLTSDLGVQGWTSTLGGGTDSKFSAGFLLLLFVTEQSFASVLLPKCGSSFLPTCCFCLLLGFSPGSLLLWVSPGCSGCQACPCLPCTHPIPIFLLLLPRYQDKLSLTPDSEKVRRTGCSSFASSLKSGLPLLPPLLAPHHSPVHQSPSPFLLLQLSHWQLGGRCLILIFNSRDDSPLPLNLGTSPPRFPSPRQFCLVGWHLTTGWQLRLEQNRLAATCTHAHHPPHPPLRAKAMSCMAPPVPMHPQIAVWL